MELRNSYLILSQVYTKYVHVIHYVLDYKYLVSSTFYTLVSRKFQNLLLPNTRKKIMYIRSLTPLFTFVNLDLNILHYYILLYIYCISYTSAIIVYLQNSLGSSIKKKVENGLLPPTFSHKETFLPAFKAAYNLTFTKDNACAGFRGARLVLFNLEAVLLKLNVRLRTLSLPQRNNVAQEAKTLRNAKELKVQTTLI